MSSGFVSEADIAAARQKRQEEWEKVRTKDQPLECPEPEYDSRSLFERLQEQKKKKELEYEEAHKLKNLIRGLDDDEVNFLELVDRAKSNYEQQQRKEEFQEIEDFRKKKAELDEKSSEIKPTTDKSKQKNSALLSSQRMSQKSLLAGAIQKKRSHEQAEPQEEVKRICYVHPQPDPRKLTKGAMKCVGVLPGIGKYKESSDSEMSSDSEEETEQGGRFDLVGRKAVDKTKKCESAE